MNCAEKLLEPTIFFNIYTKSPKNSGSEVLGAKEITGQFGILISNHSIVYKI